MKNKVLIIGPSIRKSRGGMASVIQNISSDKYLNSKFKINVFSSFVDGNIVIRFLYSIFKFSYFILIFNRYDVFHIHVASYGSFFRKKLYIDTLRFFKKNIILHLHGATFLEFFDNSSKQKIINNTFKKANKVIVLSESWKREINKRMNLDNVEVINNGVIFHNNHFGLGKDNSFLFLGRLGKRKGTYDLLKAIKIVGKDYPQIRFYFCGDGEIEQVNKLIKEEKLEHFVSVEGWCSKNKIKEILRVVSTMILPSYNEGLPMSILESMEQGKIIISTNVGGIPEVVVDNENGYLVEPGNVDQIKESIIKVISNHKKNIVISNNNISKIHDHFNVKVINKKIGEIYSSLL